MVTIDHTRHSQIFDASRLSATVIGAGGIGAISALTIAKMGVGALTLYDDELVGPENIATQWHRLSDVGKSKVLAIKKEIAELAGDISVTAKPLRVGNEVITDHIIISAVDSITSRQKIWEAIDFNWYIDARMAAEEFQMFVVDASNREQMLSYHEHLMSLHEDDVEDLPCTSKATVYTSAFAAGYISLALKSIATGQDFPFFIVHNLPNHFFLKAKE